MVWFDVRYSFFHGCNIDILISYWGKKQTSAALGGVFAWFIAMKCHAVSSISEICYGKGGDYTWSNNIPVRWRCLYLMVLKMEHIKV